MVQNSITPIISPQLIKNILGYSLSEGEFQRYQQKFKYLEPKVGKFWQGTRVEAGIYIVLAGKVRLLDEGGELISTLEAGEAFGHFTLFPSADFLPYAARAGTNVQLCFIPGELLLSMMAKYQRTFRDIR